MIRMEGRSKAFGSIEPHAVREFRNADLEWLLHRQIYLKRIDVLQLEYMVLGQYAGGFRRIPSIVFEHDVYFQSIARRLPMLHGLLERMQARFEYLRALRWELGMLPKADRIQVCSRENREHLESFVPALRGRIDDGLRAGIDTSRYKFSANGREPLTMLFLGSFRHAPNMEALTWFVRDVLPLIRVREPRARLMIVGSDPPPRHSLPEASAIELVGQVEDIREPLARYAVFLCPILSGSGVRVKLLEAFAAGIPVVSTRLGAEGLTAEDGAVCLLADDAAGFAERVVTLLQDTGRATEIAVRARDFVVANRDLHVMTDNLIASYREQLARMRRDSDPPAEVKGRARQQAI
jgi:glycosyltransferase involved in cell wall biosynthesis